MRKVSIWQNNEISLCMEGTDAEDDAVQLLDPSTASSGDSPGRTGVTVDDEEQELAVEVLQPSADEADASQRRGGALWPVVAVFDDVSKYFSTLSHVYTGRFLALLLMVQVLLKGFVYIVVGKGMFPIMRALNVEAERTQVYSNAATSPWAIKPVIGVLSDVFILGGRRKKYAMLLATVAGCLGAVMLCFGISNELVVTMGMIALRFARPLFSWNDGSLFSPPSFQASTCDLLSEAKYSEVVRDNPTTASGITVFVNGAQRTGYVLAFLAVGPLLATGNFLILFVLTALCCFSVFVPILMNFLPETVEQRVAAHIGCRYLLLDWPKVKEQWKMLLPVIICGLLSPVIALIPVFWNTISGLILGISVFYGAAFLLVLAAYLVFPSRYVALVAGFEVVKRIMRPSIDSGLDYFYTSACVVGGPNLSIFFYVTVAGLVSAGASLIGLVLYQRFLRDWSFQKVVLFTCVLNSLGSATDVFVVLRWNVVLGMPDTVAVLVGDAVIQPIVSMLNWLPGSILIAKVCPPGLESSVFAFLAGLSNLALGGANLTGALIMNLGGISSNSCNFENLPWLVLACHVVSPLLIGTAASFVLPRQSQNSPVT